MKARNLLATLLFCATFATAGTASAELRIGFVNAAKVLEEAPQAAAARDNLQQEFEPRDRELVSMQKEIRALEEKLGRDAAVMSETERRNLERDILNRKRDLKRSQDVFREDFNLRRNEELGKLQRLVVETIRAISKEQNYDLMLTEGVLYASDQVDVTDRVLQKLKEQGSR
ncbi:MAG: OmpH family outer membrane protein [Gammaproteobacteria bacterium]|nr:OmpH family outer membrane protein [Gammaproteobacteria bacterium]